MGTILPDHVRGLFGDHDRGGVGVGRGQRRHDRGPGGEDQPLRLDFFGDEIETVRRFDPTDQRTTGNIDGFTLLPASEALLDEESIKRFRGRYHETFGATATGDPLYQAVSEGRRLSGMEHWLPLFEEKLVPLTDHLADDTLILLDHGVVDSAEARFEAIRDYHANRVQAKSSDLGAYRPLKPEALYLDATVWAAITATWPMHATMLETNRSRDEDSAKAFEFLRIVTAQDGVPVYWAAPSGGSRTPFRLIEFRPRSATFENLANAYPTRIRCRRSGETMTATIKGAEGARPMSWTWRRLPPHC
jgi:hypothetical protein